MEQPPVTNVPGRGADGCAADKIQAAFDLLASAFQDTRVDSAALSKDDLIEQVAATQQVLNTVWAVQSARLAQVGAIEEVFTADSEDPAGFRTREFRHAVGSFRAEFVGSDVGTVLGWTSGAAEARVAEASDAITRTPRLFARVGTGEVEPAKLITIHRALGRVVHDVLNDGTRATLDLAREVEGAFLGDPEAADTAAEAAAVEQGNVDLLGRQSAAQVRHRAARLLAALDPVAADKAATRRRRDRVGVFARPDEEPGLSQLHAVLPCAVAAKLMAAVDRHARELRAETSTDKTLSECRADALADLILGNATVDTQLVVQVPVHYTGSNGTREDTRSGTRGAGSTRWGGFAHPVNGFTVFPGGWQPTYATTATTSPTDAGTAGPATNEFRAANTGPVMSAGVAVKSQDTIDREFNDLLKQAYPPDLEDWAESELYDESDSADRQPPGAPPDDYHWGRPPGQGHDRDRCLSTDHCPWGTLPDEQEHRQSDQSPSAGGGGAWLGDATVPGIGVIPAAVVEAMSRSFGMTMTRALVDADTGITLETCETRYRPGAKLRRFVETRDRHCRFPGCTRPARWCDLDHVTPWPAGRTAAHNLQCLCRHHHRTKQAHGWSVTMTPEGVCTWTSPTGRRYVTTPAE